MSAEPGVQSREEVGQGGSVAAPAAAPDLQPDEAVPSEVDAPADVSLAGRPEITNRSAIADATILGAATYLAQGLLFMAGIIQKGLLGPAGTGYWSLMQTFWTWLTLATFGAFDGASRQIPTHRGAGDYEAAAGASDTGSSFSVAAMAVLGAILIAVALIFGGDWAPELRFGIVLLGLTAPLRLFIDAHKVVLQGVKRFDITAAADVASAAVILTVQTVMVALFGFYGMFAGLTASLLAMYAVWKRLGVVGWRRPVFSWRIDRSRVGELMSFGAPIMIYGQIWILFMAVDSLIVASLLGVRQLGYYSLALSVTTYIMLVPQTIAAVLFPRMAEQFGSTGDIHAIGHFATRVQQVLSTTMVPALMGAGFFLVPVLIRHALPEFTPGIAVTQIVVAGTFFLAVSNMPRKLLYTAGYRWPLAAMMAGCLTFNAAVNLIAIAVLDLGIKGAAGATAASYFVVFMSSTVYALSKLASVREIVAHVGELVLLFLYAATAMYGIDALITPPTGLFADIAVSVGCYLLYLVLLVPCFVWGEKRYGGGRQIWSAVGGGWRRLRGGEATG